MPPDEWKSNLATLGGEFDRADYHLSRFHSLLTALKARREVAGGPVFADPAPARATYCEAVSYLSAVRTAVDIIVYVAARRSGCSIQASEKWSASKAISAAVAMPGSKYSTDDIEALRQHRTWFEELNHYRNCMHHRGWHEQSFGYFSRTDTAPEANDPAYNAMLVPDLAPIIERARPHSWTYLDRVWLDTLVEGVAAGTESALEALLEVWNLPVPVPGKIPLEEQPTVFSKIPLLQPISGQSPPTLHLFLSKEAAHLFLKVWKNRNLELVGCSFRALRRATLAGYGAGYLVAYETSTLGKVAELHLHEAKLGQLELVDTHTFSPPDSNGPVSQTLWFQLPSVDQDVLYVLDCI